MVAALLWLVFGRSVPGVGIGPAIETFPAGFVDGVMMGADFNGDGSPAAAGPGVAVLLVTGELLVVSGETCIGEAARTSGTEVDLVTPGSTTAGRDVAEAAGAGNVGALFAGEAAVAAAEPADADGNGLAVCGTAMDSDVTESFAGGSGVCDGAVVDGTGPTDGEGPIEGCVGVSAGIGCVPAGVAIGCRGTVGAKVVPCPVAVSFGVARLGATGACFPPTGNSFESAADFVAGGFSATFSGTS